MTFARIGGAALLLATVSGCYQARVAVIDDGVPLSFGEIAACQIGEKPFRFDLTHPERTAGGGTTYRLGDETLAFKPLSDTLYLAQLNSSGLYRYGYILRNGDAVEVLALNQDVQTDPAIRPSAADILFKPEPNGWQEMVGARADLATFLTSAKLGMMHSVGQCTLRKAISPDALLIDTLKLSTTREQALELPGAEACDLADVCLPPSPSVIEHVPVAERPGIRLQAAFDPDRIHSVTLTGKGLSPTGVVAVLNHVKLGSSRVGAFAVPLVLAFNGERADLLKARMQVRADPQRAADLMRPFERLKDIRSAVGDPDFRSAEIVAVPAETFATIKSFANAQAAMSELLRRGDPFTRTILNKIDTGKIGVTVEIVP